MKKATKSFICIILSAAFLFVLSACTGSAELTEDNVSKTVESAAYALHEFNSKDLKKYVDSDTLSYIISLADKHEQFAQLGRAMFENLDITVKSIDLEGKTVEVEVVNKDLFFVASNFTYDLTNNYSTIQLLSLLNDESFLNSSLNNLTNDISQTAAFTEPKTVQLSIVQGKKNLILKVDEEAENAISGGALSAVKSIIK